MKKILFYLLGIVALSASLSGCSGINRLIKGGDPEAIYAKGVELYDAGKWSKAITLLQNVENYYSGTSKADTLSFYIARAHFKNRSYDTASELFDTYRRTFGRSPFIEDAEGMYAMCFYYLSPSPQRDQTVTGQAIVAISEFMSRYPDSEKYGQFEQMRNELTGRLHDKEFLNAYTYYKIGKHKSAIVALKNAPRRADVSDRRFGLRAGAQLGAAQADRPLSLDARLLLYLHRRVPRIDPPQGGRPHGQRGEGLSG